MSDFIRLTSESELPPLNEAREFTVGDRVICVANVEGAISAMDNVCLHRGGPLAQGVIEGSDVICPWHGWAWNTRTGEAGHSPAAKVEVYPIKVENGDVLIKI
jgi:nitrite reductase (NADH) small subunit